MTNGAGESIDILFRTTAPLGMVFMMIPPRSSEHCGPRLYS
jgi:hypothetical protein